MDPLGKPVRVTLDDEIVYQGFLKQVSHDGMSREIELVIQSDFVPPPPRGSGQMTRSEFVQSLRHDYCGPIGFDWGANHKKATKTEEKEMDKFKAYTTYDERTRSFIISIEDEDGKFLTSLDGTGERLERAMGGEMPIAAKIPEELFNPIMASRQHR